MPMLAAAGMVVTEMSTPISAPDLAVERLSMPAAPAHSATMNANASGLEMLFESAWSSVLNESAGRCSAASNSSTATTVAAIASGKPTASASAERRASGAAQLDERHAQPGDAARTPGPTTIAPTTRIGLSRKMPIAAMIDASTM